MTLNPARGFWVMMNCELLYRGVVWFVAFWWKNDWNEINPPIIWRECSVVLHVREERARARCQMWITPLGTSPDCSIKRNLLKTTQAERFLPPSEMTLFVYPWHLKSRTLRSRSGQNISTHWLRRHHIFLWSKHEQFHALFLLGYTDLNFFA